MKRKDIPKKNYVIMGIVVVVTVCLTFYLTAWYKTIKEYYQNNSVIVEIISEIEAESISSYLLDNHIAVIYLASSNDQEIKSFEKQFKKVIADNDLNSDIVYFDTSNLDSEYINNVLLDYVGSSFKKIKNFVVPNLIYFENGEIVDLLYAKKTTIRKSDVVSFLERNNVITDD